MESTGELSSNAALLSARARNGFNSPWLLRFSERSDAHARIFCFPHAGGVGQTFRAWASPDNALATAAVEVVAITPPARAQRLEEEPLQLRATVDAIVSALRPLIGTLPYAFFGHSLGSLLAYEVARELQNLGLPAPFLLIVSAHAAPHMSGVPVAERISALPTAEFKRELRRWALLPAEVLEDEELVELMLPALRADLRMHEEYEPLEPLRARAPTQAQAKGQAKGPAMSQALEGVRVVALGGRDDQTVPETALQGWASTAAAAAAAAAETRVVAAADAEAPPATATPPRAVQGAAQDAMPVSAVVAEQSKALAARQSFAPFELKLFDGGHFYLFDDDSTGAQAGNEPAPAAAVLQHIAKCLRSSIDARPRAVVRGPTVMDYGGDEHRCVHHMFMEQARRTPHAVAIVGANREYTYAEVDHLSNLLARRLRRGGMPGAIAVSAGGEESPPRAQVESDQDLAPAGPGCIVGIFLPHCAEYIIANIAIFKAGAAMLLLETSYTPSLIREVLEGLKPTVVITMAHMLEKLPSEATGVVQEDAGHTEPVIDAETEQVRNITVLLDEDDEWAKTLEIEASALSSSDAAAAAAADAAAAAGVGLRDLAYITFSSGSTGKPKSILCPHIGATFCVLPRFELYPYRTTRSGDASSGADEREQVVEREGLNVFFAWELMRPLCRGQTAVVIPDDVIFDPRHLLRFIQHQRITRLMVTPSLMQNILDYPGLDLHELMGHMVLWFLEGEVCTSSLAARFDELAPPNVDLVNVYASWEALDLSYASLRGHNMLPPRTPVDVCNPAAPAGRPMANVQMYVIDPRSHELLPRGVPGELLVASTTDHFFDCYGGDPEKTAQRRFPNPFAGSEPPSGELETGVQHGSIAYLSGDRAMITVEGDLQVLGRDDFTVKIRGFKVALGLVEASLKDVDGVGGCCVVAAKDPETDQPSHLCAYLTAISDTSDVDANVSSSAGDGEPIAAGTKKPDRTMLLRVQAALRKALPEYAVPSVWVPLTAMPLKGGESRKLDRSRLPPPPPLTDDEAALREPATTKSNLSTPQPPNGRLHRVLTEAFATALSMDPSHVAPDANFFELGGHSLLASQLVGVLSDMYGIALTVLDIYQHPTVLALAAHCAAADGGAVEAKPGSSANSALRGSSSAGTASHAGRENAAGSTDTRLAIIGMAAYLPGAANVDEFWHNLCDGKDATQFFTEDELRSRGVREDVLANKNWVRAAALVQDPPAYCFDAGFWGIGRREAELMDPQQRLFLQCAWEALEDAGYAPRSGTPHATTGVFAACGIDGYLLQHLRGGPIVNDPLDPAGVWLTETGNEKDYIATRVAYQLDLGGPAVTVNSACSSGLIAVCQAASALRDPGTECDLAVAGAASLTFPSFGYLYGEGLPASPDGRVRPFDVDAGGTVFGDGIGAVILKRLSDAVTDSDNIWAVLSGSAVTNDGNRKAGYSAPSAAAQARAIVAAQRMARVSAEDVGYIECHATATHVGDAIELQGLIQAFKMNSSSESKDNRLEDSGTCTVNCTNGVADSKWCALGSVKGNIGHANCAAGLSGLIKAVLCVKHRSLVPTAHFNAPSPKLAQAGLEESPFYVNEGARPWVTPLPRPNGNMRNDDFASAGRGRRFVAGVSSFGVGGTNAHCVLERFDKALHSNSIAEPAVTPDTNTCAESSNLGGGRWRASQLLVFSAKTPYSLHASVSQMASHLAGLASAPKDGTTGNVSEWERLELARVALTLQSGREPLPLRASAVVPADSLRGAADAVAAVARNIEDEIQAAEDSEDGSTTRASAAPSPGATVVMVFPGQGSQHVAMGRALYRHNRLFAQHFDKCADLLSSPQLLGRDLRDLLLFHGSTNPASGCEAEVEREFLRPTVLQPALFSVEYSLAMTYIACGVTPVAVAGHSIGEYVAATISQILPLPSALGLVYARAEGTEYGHVDASKRGTMLSVRLSEAHVRAYVEGKQTQARQSGPGQTDELDMDVAVFLAAVNSPVHTVLSGSDTAIAAAEQELLGKSEGTVSDARNFGGVDPSTGAAIRCVRLHVTNAFHSPLMEAAGRTIETFVGALRQSDDVADASSTPQIPMTSNVTGGWLHDEANLQDRDASTLYWTRHLLGTVRWLENVNCFLRWEPDVVLEVGPGNTLSTLVRKCLSSDTAAAAKQPLVVHSMARAVDAQQGTSHDELAFATALGKLWEAGVNVAWDVCREQDLEMLGAPARCPARLPRYCWERTRIWQNPSASIYAPLENEDAELEIVEDDNDDTDLSMLQQPHPCLVRFSEDKARSSASKAVLYCFPYAGGSSRMFEDWTHAAAGAHVPAWLDVVAIELRGRGGRADDDVHEGDDEDQRTKLDLEELQNLARAIRDDASGRPIAFCGFSYGALIAAEVAAFIESANKQQGAGSSVSFLAVVGRAPPFVTRGLGATNDVSTADIEAFNLAPPSVRASEAWSTYFEPMLLRDLRADGRASRRLAKLANDSKSKAPKLRSLSHLVVACGMTDPSFSHADVPLWRQLAESEGTALTFTPLYYPGGHDFMNENNNIIFGQIAAAVAQHGLKIGAAGGAGDENSALNGPLLEQLARVERTMHQGATGDNEVKDTVLHRVQWQSCMPSPPDDADIATVSNVRVRVCKIHGGSDDADPCNATEADIDAAYNVDGRSALVVLLDTTHCAAEQHWVEAQERQCYRLMCFMHELLELPRSTSLTKGNIVLVAPCSASSAMAFGASRAIALEYPEIAIQRVRCDLDNDVAAGASNSVDVQHLVALCRKHEAESDLVVMLHDQNDAITAKAAESGGLTGAVKPQLSARISDRSLECVADLVPPSPPRKASMTTAAQRRAGRRHRRAAKAQKSALSVRTTQVLVPRLVQVESTLPSPEAQVPLAALSVDADAGERIVVTGGTGGLGRLLIDWLLDVQGVSPAALVLVCRRAVSHPRGLKVVVADLTSTSEKRPAALAALNDALGSSSGCHVVGVLHLAGSLDDALLGSLVADERGVDRVRDVTRPKAQLLVRLLEAGVACNWAPDWALCFSSTSSLLGYAAQSNYCAANALLDDIAQWGCPGTDSFGVRQSTALLPCPVIAVNWGPWADAGMAAVGTRAYDAAVADGDTPMPSAVAFAALEQVFARVDAEAGLREASPRDASLPPNSAACMLAARNATEHDRAGASSLALGQFAVCSVEWGKSGWSGAPMVRGLEQHASARAALQESRAALSAAIQGARAACAGGVPSPEQSVRGSQRRGARAVASSRKGGSSSKKGATPVAAFLREQVTRWAPAETLSSLGVDSLDMVQMRNSFGKAFGVTAPLAMFTKAGQTLGALSKELGTILGDEKNSN